MSRHVAWPAVAMLLGQEVLLLPKSGRCCSLATTVSPLSAGSSVENGGVHVESHDLVHLGTRAELSVCVCHKLKPLLHRSVVAPPTPERFVGCRWRFCRIYSSFSLAARLVGALKSVASASARLSLSFRRSWSLADWWSPRTRLFRVGRCSRDAMAWMCARNPPCRGASCRRGLRCNFRTTGFVQQSTGKDVIKW